MRLIKKRDVPLQPSELSSSNDSSYIFPTNMNDSNLSFGDFKNKIAEIERRDDIDESSKRLLKKATETPLPVEWGLMKTSDNKIICINLLTQKLISNQELDNHFSQFQNQKHDRISQTRTQNRFTNNSISDEEKDEGVVQSGLFKKDKRAFYNKINFDIFVPEKEKKNSLQPNEMGRINRNGNRIQEDYDANASLTLSLSSDNEDQSDSNPHESNQFEQHCKETQMKVKRNPSNNGFEVNPKPVVPSSEFIITHLLKKVDYLEKDYRELKEMVNKGSRSNLDVQNTYLTNEYTTSKQDDSQKDSMFDTLQNNRRTDQHIEYSWCTWSDY